MIVVRGIHGQKKVKRIEGPVRAHPLLTVLTAKGCLFLPNYRTMLDGRDNAAKFVR